jgi:hypothetical protein
VKISFKPVVDIGRRHKAAQRRHGPVLPVLPSGRPLLRNRLPTEATACRSAPPAFSLTSWRTKKRTVDGIRLGSFCRPVAMEAICQTGYYVRRRTYGSFPKSDANGGVGGSQAVDGGVTRMPLEKLLSA